jgi:hypothetical protein
MASGTLLLGDSVQAAQPGPDPAPGSVTQPPQVPQSQQASDIAKLILKLEAEISAGRSSSPAGDNAMETLQHILALMPDATPSDLDAIDAMPSRFDQRASEAEMRGDKQAAERFSAFRDAFALGGGRASSALGKASPPAAPIPSPPVTGPAPSTDFSSVVKRLEPRPETKTGENTGPLPNAGSGSANRSDSTPDRAEPHPTALTAAPKPARVPDGSLKPDQAKTGANPKPPSPANVRTIPPAMVIILLRRGEEKLLQGDISAARLLFQRAAAARSGAGAAGLAKTYDPLFLGELGAGGIQADAGLATEWYRKAIALGEDGAAASLSKLEQWKLENAEGLKPPAALKP